MTQQSHSDSSQWKDHFSYWSVNRRYRRSFVSFPSLHETSFDEIVPALGTFVYFFVRHFVGQKLPGDSQAKAEKIHNCRSSHSVLGDWSYFDSINIRRRSIILDDVDTPIVGYFSAAANNDGSFESPYATIVVPVSSVSSLEQFQEFSQFRIQHVESALATAKFWNRRRRWRKARYGSRWKKSSHCYFLLSISPVSFYMGSGYSQCKG